ncbi:soma ferritin, partial [Asbolus verrucosus]
NNGVIFRNCKTSNKTALIKYCTCPAKNDSSNKKPFRHNYHEEVEAAVNNQILAELNASMVYLSLYCYYGGTSRAMPGCQSFFKKMYNEEQDHAMVFIDYQLLRGGEVKLFPITVPENPDWTDITIALGIALELEKRVKDKLECLYRTAESCQDTQLMDLVTTKFIKDQNESIWELGRLLTRAKRLVDTGGVGRHLFDRELFNYATGKNPAAGPPLYM